MSEITMIGLGAIGSALAQTLLKAGRGVTVWNRSPKKMEPLVALGARGTTDLGEAIEASSRLMICITDYAATSVLLNQPGVPSLLNDRTVIQFSTGTPKEAADFETWVGAQGATYLDGAIMVNPASIGGDDAQILVAGPEETFEQCQGLLSCLGGDLRYLGANVRAAATLDLALLSYIECAIFGVIHGVSMCESEGISLEQFADLLPEGTWGRPKVQFILENAFGIGPGGATVDVIAAILKRLQDQARNAGINSEIPDLLSSLLQRAIMAGYGGEDTAAVIKVLRDTNRP